jgi:Mn-dependent DtxR family transcriptional regulator
MSKTEQIVASLADGKRNKDISAMFAVTPAQVSQVRKEAIRKGLLRAKQNSVVISFAGSEILDAIRREAEKRSLTTEELLSDIVCTIATDDLFKAIID